jgi:hypothetical protein
MMKSPIRATSTLYPPRLETASHQRQDPRPHITFVVLPGTQPPLTNDQVKFRTSASQDAPLPASQNDATPFYALLLVLEPLLLCPASSRKHSAALTGFIDLFNCGHIQKAMNFPPLFAQSQLNGNSIVQLHPPIKKNGLSLRQKSAPRSLWQTHLDDLPSSRNSSHHVSPVHSTDRRQYQSPSALH